MIIFLFHNIPFSGNEEEKGEQDKTENKEGDNSNKDKAEKEQEAAVDPVQ